MRAIEGNTITATPRYEHPFQPPLTIVQPEPRRTGATERWFAAAMFGSMLLFVIALAKFVIDPAVKTVSQPASASTTQGP